MFGMEFFFRGSKFSFEGVLTHYSGGSKFGFGWGSIHVRLNISKLSSKFDCEQEFAMRQPAVAMVHIFDFLHYFFDFYTR